MRRAWEYIITVGAAILLALIVRNSVLTAYRVPTISMAPTLKPGDFIFANRIAYDFSLPLFGQIREKTPSRGDLVIFNYNDGSRVTYVKRVIGLPGDKITISQGRIKLNGADLIYEDISEKSIEDLPGAQYLNVFEEKSLGQAGSSHKVMFNTEVSPGAEVYNFEVPPDHVFLLGDNRDASDDSRDRGPVAIKDIQGRVVFIWLSLDYHKKWMQNRMPGLRWERTMSFVD